ncbi:MAG: YcjF family protein [Thioploca sp.]|nr:YcjF family protein [Thioploca sp.]
MDIPNDTQFEEKDSTPGNPLTADANSSTQGEPKLSDPVTPTNEEELLNQKVTTNVNRASQAHHTVKNYMMGATVTGLIPLPLVDTVAVTAIQLKMIHSLAKLYEVPFSKDLAKSLITSLLSGTITLSTTVLARSIPVVGQAMGIISAMMVGGATTYATGKIFVEHFESGGNFFSFDPEKMRAHFQALYEEGKQLAIQTAKR